MTLHELDSASAVNSFKSNNANTVICFSATWCGPCKASKPELESIAATYQQDPSIDVRFGIVYEHNLSEGIHEFGVRAFPTYILFTNNGSKMAGKIEGVNFEGVKQLIAANGCKKDLGVGQSLGGTGSDKQLSAAEARAQRLAMFDKKKSPAQDASMEEDNTNDENDENNKKQDVTDEKMEEKDENTEITPMEAETSDDKPKATNDESKDIEMKDATETATTEEEEDKVEMVDPTTNLSIAHLDTLTGEMGFELLRAQKGLLFGTGGVEGAVEWLMNHQDDADIDEPIGLVPKDSTMSATPRTAEEIAAKVAEVKALLKAKRMEREEIEKVDDILREKQRRSMGQQVIKTKEEMEQQARAREAKQRRKEKEAFKKERARLRAELEKDKAERRAHKGKLQSKLGIEGYHPDAIQYDVDVDGDGDDEHKTKDPVKKKPKASVAKIDEYVAKVSAYRAGGDGGKCLKILLLYIKNVVDNPDEDKFRHISMESKAFKGKVKPFVGAKSLLLALGFSPNEGGTALDLVEDADRDVLAETRKKLEAALAAY